MGDGELKLVTVFSTGNPALIALAKGILEGEGIPFLVKNEAGQDLLGWGRLGAGYNPIIGVVHIQVREDDAPHTIDLLGDLSEQ